MNLRVEGLSAGGVVGAAPGRNRIGYEDGSPLEFNDRQVRQANGGRDIHTVRATKAVIEMQNCRTALADWGGQLRFGDR